MRLFWVQIDWSQSFDINWQKLSYQDTILKIEKDHQYEINAIKEHYESLLIESNSKIKKWELLNTELTLHYMSIIQSLKSSSL